jgi:NADH-quinone oxidoreductase subunit N
MFLSLRPELASAEIFLAVAGMALLMLGVFRKDNTLRLVTTLAVAALALAAVLVGAPESGSTLAFGGGFVVDDFAVFAKMLILLGSAIGMVIALRYLENEDIARFEYPVLLLFATLGMMIMVSANDLLTLYVGLELQSLSLYVIAAFHRDNARSSEAGLKYFILGALASGMLLYGSSLIYGFTGTINFTDLAALFAEDYGPVSIGVVAGLVFVLAGLAFKASAVPFHMWTPDVYEGAPTSVTAFFAMAPKIAALALFLRVMVGPFGDLIEDWRQVVVFISIASMGLGAFAALVQTNIKRLMAYSSIGHVGYALIGLAVGNELGVQSVLIYLSIYLVMTAGAFTCILAMRRRGDMVERIEDLAGLSRTQPMMAAALAVFMFSMAGIPPMAGFFSKLYIFLAAVDAGLYALAIIGVLTSVVGAYYYLRIVKVMYFDEPTEAFDQPVSREMTLVMAASGLFTLLFFIYPAPLLAGAATAAAALFAG